MSTYDDEYYEAKILADVNDYSNEVAMLKEERARKAKALGAFYLEQSKQRKIKAVEDRKDNMNSSKIFLDYNHSAKQRTDKRHLEHKQKQTLEMVDGVLKGLESKMSKKHWED